MVALHTTLPLIRGHNEASIGKLLHCIYDYLYSSTTAIFRFAILAKTFVLWLERLHSLRFTLFLEWYSSHQQKEVICTSMLQRVWEASICSATACIATANG
jgi:hypothetical protein